MASPTIRQASKTPPQPPGLTTEQLVALCEVSFVLSRDLESATKAARHRATASLKADSSSWELRAQLSAWGEDVVSTSRAHVARYLRLASNKKLATDIGTWVRHQLEARVAAHLRVPVVGDGKQRSRLNVISNFVCIATRAESQDSLPAWIVPAGLGRRLASIDWQVNGMMLSAAQSGFHLRSLEDFFLDELSQHMTTIDDEITAELAALGREDSHAATIKNVFFLDGELWRIAFDGEDEFWLKDRRGLGYYHFLLENRGSVSSLELVTLCGPGKIDLQRRTRARQMMAGGRDDDGKPLRVEMKVENQAANARLGHDDMIDKTAEIQYQKEIERLTDRYLIANQTGNTTKANELLEEIMQIRKYSAQSKDGIGRSRKFSTQGTKARISVKGALDEARAAIEKMSPRLAKYLKVNTITGYDILFCDDRTKWITSLESYKCQMDSDV